MAEESLAPTLARVRAALAEVPEGKTGALVVAVRWQYGVPLFTTGLATKVGDHLTLGAQAETKFSKVATAASVYAAVTW